MKRCRGCGKIIKFIRSIAGRLIPVNPEAVEADGEKLLVFADGRVGREHPRLKHGFATHFSDCPKASSFKNEKSKKAAISTNA